MTSYTIECKDNGFFYESKSLSKICEMFDLKYTSTYNSVRNTLYNQRGSYIPSNKKNITIKRNER